jgi:iron complex outermembrane recepter protein
MSSRRRLLRRGLRIGTLAASIGSVMATGGWGSKAWAQEQQEGEARQQATEEIIVTGSRIRRDEFTSANAMSVVSGADMQALGVISVADMINQLPNNIASISPEANTSSEFDVGASIANLRGLNTYFGTRTLTLVNGRRAVSTNTGGSVDLNSVPSALVSRIETVTGGASATYGADALAGVVNVILDNRLEGYRMEFGHQTTQERDGDRYNLSFATGTPLLEGRAHFTVALDVSTQDGINDCMTRDYCRRGMGIFENGQGVGTGFFGFGPPLPYSQRQDIVFEGQPQWMIVDGMRHTSLPSGILLADDFTTDCDDMSCGAWRITPDGMNVVPYLDDLTVEQRNAVDVQGWNGTTPWSLGKSPFADVPLLPKQSRNNLYTYFAYDLPSGIELSADASFSRNTNQALQKHPGVNQQRLCIREDNGFLQQSSQAMQDLFAARWMTGVFTRTNVDNTNDWSIVCDEPPFMGGSFSDDRVEGAFDFGPGTPIVKDFSDHLNRENNNTTDVRNFTLNASGTLFENWRWDTYWNYGKSERENYLKDFRSNNRMMMALDAVVDPLTGEIVCRVHSSDRSFDKWVYDTNANDGAGGIVNVARDPAYADEFSQDIRDKWITFYEVALAGLVPDEELTATATEWFEAFSDGCVPFNPFGDAENVPIPDDVKAFAFPRITELSDNRQNTISLNFSGDLHQGIGAGPLRMAAGADWRRLETISRAGGDEITARDFRGPIDFSGFRDFGDNWGGRTTNTEAYAEVEMPFLRDRPAARYLMLNLANRRTRNETERLAGRDLTDPISFTRYVDSRKVSLMWRPIELLTLRATRSTDMRAPSARELFQTNVGNPQAGGQREIVSPFRVNDPNTAQLESGDQYLNLDGGNSRLASETAVSETIGLVFTPPAVPGLQISVDYYETTVSGGIDQVGVGGTLNRCASEEIGMQIPEEDWVFCRNVVFDDTPDVSQAPLLALYGCGGNPDQGIPGCTEQEIAQILPYTNLKSIASSMVNQAPYWNRGVDLSLSYSRQLGGGGFLYGRIFSTRFLEQSVDLGGHRGRTNVAGQTGANGLTNARGAFGINYSPTPRLSGNAFMTYNKNAFTVTGQVRHIGAGRLNVQDTWIAPGECSTYLENDEQLVACYDPNVTDTVTLGGLPSWTTLSLNFSYNFANSARFEFGQFEDLSVFFNITNVADKTPNFFSGRDAGGANTTYFSGLGRQFNLGMRMRF